MTTTATEQISAVSVINMLGEIVDGHEDYVDHTTAYFVDEQPECIIGHVMAAYGYDEDWFRVRDGSFTMPFRRLVAEFGLPFSRKAEAILTAAQEAQDAGESWGRAYQEALAEMDEFRESETP